jgi:hypothetical protein
MSEETYLILETLAVLRHGTPRQRLRALRWLPHDILAWWAASCPDWCPTCKGRAPSCS